MPRAYERWLLAGSTLLLLVLFGLRPHEQRWVWALETAPVAVALIVLVATFRRFPLTALSYRLLWFLGLVMMVGGHYGYADVPFFEQLQEMFTLQRNSYDRLAHLVQGLAPAILFRELLLRLTPLVRGASLAVLGTAAVLALSASYEIVEWCVALVAGGGASAFLAVQGDPWDTQKDMALALVGAVVSLWLFRRTHDAQLATFDPTWRVRK